MAKTNTATIKIDNVPVDIQFPTEFIEDGTEAFNVGVLYIKNTTRRLPYDDYADVEITLLDEVVNGVPSYKVVEAVVQRDEVVRTTPGLWNHTVTLVEPVVKFSQYSSADRQFSTIDGNKITYLDQLFAFLNTLRFGKIVPFTISAATQTLLNVEAVEKEYIGGDFFVTLLDMFRSVNAVPRLTLNNVIGHELIGVQGVVRDFDPLQGETITSDISDYGMKVYSKLKNATYEGDLTTGGTYYPAKGYGVTVRSSKDKYDDNDAEYVIDSGIRFMIQARVLNVGILGVGDVVAEVSKFIVPKETWDSYIIERDSSTLQNGIYKNNSFYFVEGDNIITNVGTKYKNSAATVNGDDVMEWLLKSWLIQDSAYPTGTIVAKDLKEYEIEFYYRATRDLDTVQERHNISRTKKRTVRQNNQKDTKLELGRWGKANKSFINRQGNDRYEPTINFTAPPSVVDASINWKIPDIGDTDNLYYTVVKKKYLIRQNNIDVQFLLVQNASFLNPFTGVNRTVSPFTIQQKNTKSCFVYEEYLEFSSTSRTDDGYLSTIGRKTALNALKWDINYDKPVYAGQYVSTANGSQRINMSALTIPQGNTFVFNVGFQDPQFAGVQLVDDSIGKKLNQINYTDVNGQVDTFTLQFYNTVPPLSNDPDLLPVGDVPSDTIINSKSYNVDLNPNEILQHTHCIHTISNIDNLIIGNYFLENNSLVSELGVAQSLTLIYYPNWIRHTIYDEVAKAGSEGSGSFSLDAAYKELTISGVPSGKSWALVETAAPFRIYLAYNNEGQNLNTIYINNLEDRVGVETL